MNALWQGGGAPEPSGHDNSAATAAHAAGLRVEVPGAAASPGVGSSRPGAPAPVVALQSPDLGQSSARNADWLGASADDGLRDLEPAETKKDGTSNAVRVTVFAGMPAPLAQAAVAAAAAGPAAGRRPIRQSLFDLVNIEIEDD